MIERIAPSATDDVSGHRAEIELDLPATDVDHRRVLAVLTYLGSG